MASPARAGIALPPFGLVVRSTVLSPSVNSLNMLMQKLASYRLFACVWLGANAS